MHPRLDVEYLSIASATAQTPRGTEKAVYICSISLVYRTMTCHRVWSMPFGLDMDMAFALY